MSQMFLAPYTGQLTQKRERKGALHPWVLMVSLVEGAQLTGWELLTLGVCAAAGQPEKMLFFISRRRNSSVSHWTSGPTGTSWARGRWNVSVTGL